MKDINIILDNCIERIARGESIAEVLADYPDEREKLEPLIRTSMRFSGIVPVKPSPEFVNTSKTSLMRKIYCEQASAKKKSPAPGMISGYIGSFLSGFASKRRLTVAASAVMAAVLIFTIGQFTFMKPTPAYAAECFLRILSGDVSIMEDGEDTYIKGTDGMSLVTGTTIKTEVDSHALLAFFDGSTITLDPDTTLEIIEMSGQDEQSRTIILKQWLGRTWSRVEKLIDADSQYEIETPSAMAVVRGTLFATEVSDNGSTAIETTRGLVSVVGENEEVFVPANKKTEVTKGKTPSQPEDIPAPLTQIVITIEGPATGSINDPNGSSTGNFPDGMEFNQIPGSVTSISPEGYQVITITEPDNGKYNLTLRYLEEGTATYHIQGMSGNQTVFNFPGIIDGDNENGSIINFSLKTTGNNLDIGTVEVKALGRNNAPEKIVKQSEFKADPKETNVPASDKSNEKSQGNSNGKGQSKISDNSTSPVDGNAANEDKGNSSDKDRETGNSSNNNNKSDSEKSDDAVTNGNGQGTDKKDTDKEESDTKDSSGKGNSENKGNNSTNNSSSGNSDKDASNNNENSSTSEKENNGNNNDKKSDEEDTSDQDKTDNGNGNGNGNSSSSEKENNGNGNDKEKTSGKGNSKKNSDTTNNTTSDNSTVLNGSGNITSTTYILDGTE